MNKPVAAGTVEMTVAVTEKHYRFLAETSAAHFGLISARRLAHTGIHHRLDNPLGTLLCEAWLIDPKSAKLALTAFMVALRSECKRRDVPPPSLHEVIAALPHSTDLSQFPDIEFRAICDSFEDEIPELYGTSI